MSELRHVPVLVEETLHAISPKAGDTVVDCTVGLADTPWRLPDELATVDESLGLISIRAILSGPGNSCLTQAQTSLGSTPILCRRHNI